MKVLAITSYEDANIGYPTAVVTMREGEKEDDVFLTWLRKTVRYYKEKSNEELLEEDPAPYAWKVYEVEGPDGGEVKAGQIRFTPNPRRSEESIARRVAEIVIGHKAGQVCLPSVKDLDYKWQLGGGNNWWMNIDEETGEYIVAYRYGIGQDEMLAGLQSFLNWTFR